MFDSERSVYWQNLEHLLRQCNKIESFCNQMDPDQLALNRLVDLSFVQEIRKLKTTSVIVDVDLQENARCKTDSLNLGIILQYFAKKIVDFSANQNCPVVLVMVSLKQLCLGNYLEFEIYSEVSVSKQRGFFELQDGSEVKKASSLLEPTIDISRIDGGISKVSISIPSSEVVEQPDVLIENRRFESSLPKEFIVISQCQVFIKLAKIILQKRGVNKIYSGVASDQDFACLDANLPVLVDAYFSHVNPQTINDLVVRGSFYSSKIVVVARENLGFYSAKVILPHQFPRFVKGLGTAKTHKISYKKPKLKLQIEKSSVSRRCLLTGFESISRSILIRSLVKFGCMVVAMENNDFSSIAEYDQQLDYVFIDIECSSYSNEDKIVSLKQLKALKPELKVIAFDQFNHLIDQRYIGYVDRVLFKPINLQLLEEALEITSQNDGIKKMHSLDETKLDQERLQNFCCMREVGEAYSFLERLLFSFENKMPAMLFDLREAIDRQKLKDVEKVSHKIKGSAGNIGAISLMNKAAFVEKECRNLESFRLLELCEVMDLVFHRTVCKIKKEWVGRVENGH